MRLNPAASVLGCLGPEQWVHKPQPIEVPLSFAPPPRDNKCTLLCVHGLAIALFLPIHFLDVFGLEYWYCTSGCCCHVVTLRMVDKTLLRDYQGLSLVLGIQGSPVPSSSRPDGVHAFPGLACYVMLNDTDRKALTLNYLFICYFQSFMCNCCINVHPTWSDVAAVWICRKKRERQIKQIPKLHPSAKAWYVPRPECRSINVHHSGELK